MTRGVPPRSPRPPGPRGAADLTAEELDRAVRYPYGRPAGSFVVDAATGGIEPLPPDVEAWAGGRHAVLAVGSNGSPEQLMRKFGSIAGERSITVLAVTVRDHDVVHAALVADYGAIPATLLPSPGTIAAVKLTLLTDGQLARMSETEAVGRAYALVEIDPTVVRADGAPLGSPAARSQLGPGWAPVQHYSAMAGPLRIGGAPVALSSVRAAGRRWRALGQPEVLRRVSAAIGLDAATFVRRVVRDHAFRSEVNATLPRGVGPPDAGPGPAVRQHGRP